jgi:hypothetical protein
MNDTVMLVLALGLTAVALFAAWNQWRMHTRWTHTEGEVVELHQRVSTTNSGRVSRTWSPVIRYQDDTGRTHLVLESSSGSHPPAVGRRVQVAYDPTRPDAGQRVSALSKIGLPLGAGVVAVATWYAWLNGITPG